MKHPNVRVLHVLCASRVVCTRNRASDNSVVVKKALPARAVDETLDNPGEKDMHLPAPPPASARTASSTRMLAPDLARGFTLLGIVLANITTTWLAVRSAPASELGGIVDNSFADKIAVFLGACFVHVRGLPMFSTLLGFGVGLIALSLAKRHYPLRKAKVVLVKRYGWLAVFGAFHMVFLYFGDIMVGYGLMGMLLALFINVRDKVIYAVAGTMMTIWLLFGVFGLVVLGLLDSADPAAADADPLMIQLMDPSGASESYMGQLKLGLVMLVSAPISAVFQLIYLFPLMLIGMVWARHGVLHNPREHRPVLYGALGLAGAVVLFIGVPTGLVAVGLMGNTEQLTLWVTLNEVFGVLTGPGIVALVALASVPLQRRIERAGGTAAAETTEVPRFLVPVIALGQRSMSGYVAQSVLALILVTEVGFGFGRHLGAAESSLMGLLIWVFTLLGASYMHATGKRGPLEALHRRLAYGKKGLSQDYAAEAKLQES